MVAPITLTIKHIRGHSFNVEIDHDADTLGLKLLIWELQKIAIDQQRLVYAGKELQDATKLGSVGIEDGSFIFLVESSQNMAQAQKQSSQEVSAAVVPPAFAPVVSHSVQEYPAAPINNDSIAVNMPAPHSRYEVLSDEQASEERIVRVTRLSKYIRVYCIFGFFLSLIGVLSCCWISAVFALFYLLGWLGTRKLNRCLLVFPFIVTFIYGVVLMAGLVYAGIEGCVSEFADEYPYIWIVYGIAVFVSFLHIIIFLCIGKLMCRIGKLSRDEWCNARVRIISKGCCC